MAQSLLMYGESGLGKTTNIGRFARYQFTRTGLPTRLVTCDSGFGPVQDEVDDGMIIPLRLESAKYPIPVLNKLSKGEWPTKAINEKQGLWHMGEGAGFKALKQGVVGGIAVEGLTRICELLRKALTDEQQQTGEPLQGQFEAMGERFAFQSRGTYSAIQQLINNIVINFRGLDVDRVLFTAHEGKGKDKNGRQVFGPATTGVALTDFVSGWFEITLHNDSYQYQMVVNKKIVTRTAMRAWFQRHPDVVMNRMYWPCKLGLTPRLTASVYRYFPEGYMALLMNMETGEYTQGLDTLLAIIDSDGQDENAVTVGQPDEFVQYVQQVKESDNVDDDNVNDDSSADEPEVTE